MGSKYQPCIIICYSFCTRPFPRSRPHEPAPATPPPWPPPLIAQARHNTPKKHGPADASPKEVAAPSSPSKKRHIAHLVETADAISPRTATGPPKGSPNGVHLAVTSFFLELYWPPSWIWGRGLANSEPILLLSVSDMPFYIGTSK